MNNPILRTTIFSMLLCLCGCASVSDGDNKAMTFSNTGDSRAGYDEVWVASKSCGVQKGTQSQPYFCEGENGLDKLFDMLSEKYGDDLRVNFGPGVYYGTRLIQVLNNWKIRGAGMDITILKTSPNPESIKTVGFLNRSNHPASNFELSDLTIDFNVQALKKSNRVFSHPNDKGWLLGYYYVLSDKLQEWRPDQEYSKEPALGKAKLPSVVMWKGKEYLAIPGKALKGIEPGSNNKSWARLQPNDPKKLRKWQSGKKYLSGDAVSFDNKGYYCLKESSSTPNGNGDCWSLIASDKPHPRVYSIGVNMCCVAPKGGNRVFRAKAINGHGCWFLRKETMPFMLGGDNNVIEGCSVTDFHGDYSTFIAVFSGANNVVRNCTVVGNGESGTMGYGGWGCFDTRFENNFATNCSSATNIDSLTNKNVTFANNVFTKVSSGIKFYLVGKPHDGFSKKTMIYQGKEVSRIKREIDGLYIINNFIELKSEASSGGILIAGGGAETLDGVRNAIVSGNIIRTASGKSDAKAKYDLPAKTRAILIRYGQNITVANNYCEDGSIIAIPPVGVKALNNFYFNGKPAEVFTVKIYGDY